MDAHINHWLGLIKAGDFLQAEKQLETFLKAYAESNREARELVEPLQGELIVIVSRYNSLASRLRQHTVNRQDANVEQAQINQALTGLIQSLNNEPALVDFAKTYPLPESKLTPKTEEGLLSAIPADKRALVLGGGIVGLVAIVFGIWMWTGNQAEKRELADQEAWSKIQVAANVSGLVSYINRTKAEDIPGEHLNEATQKIDSLLWQEAEQSLKSKDYQAYLTGCEEYGMPCTYRTKAEARISELKNENTLWESIKDSASLKQLLSFVRNYPRSRHQGGVTDRIQAAVRSLNQEVGLPLYFSFDDATVYLQTATVSFYPRQAKPVFVKGKVGQALHLNGRDQYLQITRKRFMDSAPYSLSVWVRVARNFEGTERDVIMQKGDLKGKKSQYGLYVQGDMSQTNRKLRSRQFRAEASERVYSHFDEQAWNPNTWYHLAMVVNPSKGWVKTYFNGTLADSVTWRGDIPRGLGGDLFIGTQGPERSLGSRSFFPVDLDEIRYYRRAVSAADVEDLYEYGNHAELIQQYLQ